MPIVSLRFTNVGPFDEIEFEFDGQVNVFVGPNNSGKSTALMVLGLILVYPFLFPKKLLRNADAKFETHIRMGSEVLVFRDIISSYRSIWVPTDFWSGAQSRGSEGVGYTTFIPALRRSTDFHSEGPLSRQRLESRDRSERERLRKQYEDFGYVLPDELHPIAEDPELRRRQVLVSSDASLVSDQAVIQKIIELDYRAYRQNQPSIRQIINKVAALASEITEGFPIEFLGVGEDTKGLFPQFRTPDGDIPLNVLSQGTQSIIQWLAHLLIGYAEYYDYPPDLEDKQGILIIDEIDAHLHPSWQRRIIPTLTKHFPNLQIFCSTHSPLMLAGLKAGQVQLLKRDDKGKVNVSRNETDIVGWSADEILRSFLGVPSPTDLYTVKHLDRLQELQLRENLSEEEAKELEQLSHTINQDLLGGPIASQVERLADLLKQARAEFAARPKPTPSTRASTTRRRRKLSE